jgi:hypothetical protein
MPHLLLSQRMNATNRGFSWLFWEAIEGAPYLIPLSLVGLAINLGRKRGHVIAPAAWFLTNVAVLANHRPLHPHYAPLLSIPLCWLAALGVEAALWAAALCLASVNNVNNVDSAAVRKTWLISLGIILMLVGSLLPILVQAALQIRGEIARITEFNSSDAADQQAVVARLQIYRDKTHWIFSDLPVYPFCAKLSVPPELAVITEKRIDSGLLSDTRLLDLLRRYHPEQMLIGRFRYSQTVSDYISDNYVKVWEGPAGDSMMQQFIVKNIATPLTAHQMVQKCQFHLVYSSADFYNK